MINDMNSCDNLRVLELKRILADLGVSPDQACFIRGLALETIGLRTAKDIDICLDEKYRFFENAVGWKIEKKEDKVQVYSRKNIDIVFNYYKANIGISDREIIYDQRFFTRFNGLKFIRPELVFATKAIRQRPHDLVDLKLLTDYAKDNPDKWDWELVKDPVVSPSPRKDWCYQEKEELWAASHLMIAPETLLSLQFNGMEFNAVDTIVRHNAISDYLNEKPAGIELYKKMQLARVNREGWPGFRDLIDSIRQNGFDRNFPIEVDTYGTLIDGSHRLACALYFNLPLVPVNCVKKMFNRDYRIGWFEGSGFSANELELISRHQDYVLNTKGVYFTAVLWPPISQYFDEIEEFIGSHFKIISKEDHRCGDHEFVDLVRQIGSTDDIEEWKLMRKMHFLSRGANHMRFLKILVPKPTYRKKDHGKSLCVDMEILKKKVRENYKDQLDGYISDIIIHIADNPSQSLELNKILECLGSKASLNALNAVDCAKGVSCPS